MDFLTKGAWNKGPIEEQGAKAIVGLGGEDK